MAAVISVVTGRKRVLKSCCKMQVESTQFIFPIQGAANLRELNQMREEAVLTDVTIVTEERSFECHRAVLAASCPYFRAMFSRGLRECFEQSVTMHGIKPQVMEMILRYAYTGVCVLSKKHAGDLLVASDLLGLLPLRDASAKFLCKCIDAHTCLQIRRLGDAHSCVDVMDAASKFARQHFVEIVQQAEFLELGVGEVVSYLGDDDLNVTSENLVLDAARCWVAHDTKLRSKYMEGVLEQVRLPFVKPEYLQLQATVDPLIYNNPACLRQVRDARTFQISGEFGIHLNTKQRKPRKCTSKEVVLVVGGETRVGNFNEQVRDLSCYDPSTASWSLAAREEALAEAKAFGVVAMEFAVYLIGGTVKNKAIPDLKVFYTYLSKWFALRPMNEARYHHACCVLDDKLFAIGGTDGRRCLNSAESFDPETNRWHPVNPLPQAVKCPAVATLDGRVFVFGGFTDQYAICQNAQIYDLGTATWSTTSLRSIDYTCAHAAVLNGAIYLLGGSSRVVKIYDTETNSIRRACDMNQKRDNCAVASVGGKLFVTGGVSESSGSSLDSAECYCPLQNKWTNITPMPRRLYRHGSLCVRIPIYQHSEQQMTRNDADPKPPDETPQTHF